jgi:hypothetical protein
MRGSPADKAKGPQIAASSKEEESFVKYVVAYSMISRGVEF